MSLFIYLFSSWRDSKQSVLEYLAVQDESSGSWALPGVSLSFVFFINLYVIASKKKEKPTSFCDFDLGSHSVHPTLTSDAERNSGKDTL